MPESDVGAAVATEWLLRSQPGVQRPLEPVRRESICRRGSCEARMEPLSPLPYFFQVPRSESVGRVSSDPESERFARDDTQHLAALPWSAGSASRLRGPCQGYRSF